MKITELLTKIALVLTGMAWWYAGYWSFFSAAALTTLFLSISFCRDASLRTRGIERLFPNYGLLWTIAYVLLLSLMAVINLAIGGHWLLKPAEIMVGASLAAAVVNAWAIFAEYCGGVVSELLFPSTESNSLPQTKTCNKCGAKNELAVTVCWRCNNTGTPTGY